MKLFRQLGSKNSKDSTELLVDMAKAPIPETRLAAYNLMRAVAKRVSTGSQVLLSHPEFYKFLISREGETTKEGKEAKFAIVKAVYESPAKGLLADDIIKTLERILQQGPYHVEPIKPELMTD
jgi:26S proteasome non-ATPase regulatory subunit 5